MTLKRVRRLVPTPIRAAGLRLLGRAPPNPEREIELTLTLPSSGTPRVLRVRSDGRTYVARLLADTGLAGYEPDTTACFLASAEAAGSRPVYDIGANIGVFAWLAAGLTRAEVVAFEPTPNLAAQMRTVAESNALAIAVEEIALGATAGTAQLHLSDQTDSSNSLRAGFRPSRRSITVTVDTLDAYASRTGRPPAHLKLDTESTEPDVLRGASGLLAAERPWIICEVLAGRTEVDLMAILRPLGYTWYWINGTGPLHPRETIVGDPTYAHMNWLFTPEEPTATYWAAAARWRSALAALPAPTVREGADLDG